MINIFNIYFMMLMQYYDIFEICLFQKILAYCAISSIIISTFFICYKNFELIEFPFAGKISSSYHWLKMSSFLY